MQGVVVVDQYLLPPGDGAEGDNGHHHAEARVVQLAKLWKRQIGSIRVSST